MRKTPMPPRTARLKSKTRLKPRNAKRRTSEFARCYHSKARVAWVKSLRCFWCEVEGYSENAHTEGGGGSRKAGYETIAPLCSEFANGCHARYDRHQSPFDFLSVRNEVKAYAAEVEQAWRAHVGQVHGTPTQRSA